MHYREFGSTGVRVSALGFGCMRLPVVDNEDGVIDGVKASALIRKAVEMGVNYFDTAYPYHKGESEGFLGRVLEDGLREKVNIATKMPPWEVNNTDDFERIFSEQLDRLKTERIDFYLLHALKGSWWRKMKELGVLEFLERKKREGKIRFAGFSFHDEYPVFEEIVDAWSWDFCMIQFNYMDERTQAGTRGLEYAAARGMGVAVMEPLRGGNLAGRQPPAVQSVWDTAPIHRSPAEWALRWVWNWPEVGVVLSGMGNEDELRENCHVAGDAVPFSLSDDEREIILQVRDVYRERIRVPCTACGYCMPCPHGVNIPRVFSLYNDHFLYDKNEWSRNIYGLTDDREKASSCTKCGLCIPRCPQSIAIPDLMGDVQRTLGV